MRTSLNIFFVFNSIFGIAQNGGTIKSNFVNTINGYTNVDSIYNDQTRDRINKFIDKYVPYPLPASRNCISENIMVGFKIKDIYGEAALDTSSINIIEGLNKNLITASIKTLKKIPRWSHPDYKRNYNHGQHYARIIDIALVMSFSFKIIECPESPFEIINPPKDGYYSENYKINNKTKVQGFFKNGFADSLWIFYDTSGLVKCKGYFKECVNRKTGKKKHIMVRQLGEINGTKNGTWEYYDSLGQLVTKKKFKCDQLISSVDLVPDKNR